MNKRVFANGVWKSGNNLLIKVCSKMGYGYGDLGIASSLIIGNYYLARQIVRGPKFEKTPVSVGIDMSINVSKIWLNWKVSKMSNKCFSGHSAYSDQLMSILDKHNTKVIQIIRDPRDVIVSFAHWIITRPDYYPYEFFKDLSFEERMLKVIYGVNDDKLYIDSFATVLDRSYGWLTNSNVLIIRFEDLVGKQGGSSDENQFDAIMKIAKALGKEKEVDINEIAQSVFGGTHTFRSGQIGNWEKEFTDKVKKAFDEVVGDRLSMWGYK